MRLPNGQEHAVTILNLSLSGVGLKTPLRPPLLSEITIAERPLIVIRHFADGIAGEFRQMPGEPPLPEMHAI